VETADLVDEEEEEELLDVVKFNNNLNQNEEPVEETKFQPTVVKPVAGLSSKPSAKSFACRFCTKVFARPDHLTRHMSVHAAGNKPHSCHLCHRGFKHQDKLRQHLLSAHDMATMIDRAALSCSCGLEFKQEYDFYDHLSAHPQHELATTAETKSSVGAGDGEDGDNGVKFEVGESDIKQEPNESLPQKVTEKSAKKKRGRPGKKAPRKSASSGTNMTKPKKKTTHICKYCKEGFASFIKRKQHYLDAHWSELNEKGLLFTRNNSLRQNCQKQA
jgi:Zinc finger, C2H2 type